jgi:hypothetical protein
LRYKYSMLVALFKGELTESTYLVDEATFWYGVLGIE